MSVATIGEAAMNPDAKRLRDTFSAWCALAGLAGATHRKTRHQAAWPLLLAGIGYGGVLWERYTRADLRNIRSFRSLPGSDFQQLVLHAGMVAAGIGLLTRKGSHAS